MWLYPKIHVVELCFDLYHSTETRLCMNFESDFSRLLKEHFCLIVQKYIVITREKDHCDIRKFNSDKIFN